MSRFGAEDLFTGEGASLSPCNDAKGGRNQQGPQTEQNLGRKGRLWSPGGVRSTPPSLACFYCYEEDAFPSISF